MFFPILPLMEKTAKMYADENRPSMSLDYSSYVLKCTHFQENIRFFKNRNKFYSMH